MTASIYEEQQISPLPGVGDLVEGLGAEAFRGTRDRAAAERTIEFHRRLVVRERPHDEAFQPALHEILARGGEQPASKAETLIFGPQIEFVDFAVVEQAARAIATVIGIAGNVLAELQNGDSAALANGAVPPIGTATVNELAELVARDDPLISGAPSLVVRQSDCLCVRNFRAANLYQDGRHGRIEATNDA